MISRNLDKFLLVMWDFLEQLVGGKRIFSKDMHFWKWKQPVKSVKKG